MQYLLSHVSKNWITSGIGIGTAVLTVLNGGLSGPMLYLAIGQAILGALAQDPKKAE